MTAAATFSDAMRDEHLARAEQSLALLDAAIEAARAAAALAAAASKTSPTHRRPRTASATPNSDGHPVVRNSRPTSAGRK